MSFKELLSNYKNDQQIKKLDYEKSRELECLKMREKIWKENIIPGFEVLDHFNIRTLLEEIKKDVWGDGKVVRSPNKIEDVVCKFATTYDGDEYMSCDNRTATYELRVDKKDINYIKIDSDGYCINFKSDIYSDYAPIECKRKNRILEKAGEKIKEKLFKDCIAREKR